MHARLGRTLAVIAVFLCSAASLARAAPGSESDSRVLFPDTFQLNKPARAIAFRARAEMGALGILSNRIRYGEGTRVNYRKDAEQDTLFLFLRLSAELEIRDRHTLVFLYQPLAFKSEAVPGRELRIGEVRFPADAPMRFNYGFDFYRIVYQYDIFADARRELGFGGGFQIRNARVGFVSSDGERGFTDTGIGFVPLLRMRGRYVFDNALFLEAELDGWISPIPGQGRDGEVAYGAIADLALRCGVVVTRSSEAFLSLRYLGGGFRGEGDKDNPLAGPDPWTSDWLHTLTFALGLGLH